MANWAAGIRRQIRSKTLVATGVAVLAAAGQAVAGGVAANAVAPRAAVGAQAAVARAVPRAYFGTDGRIAFVRNGDIFSINLDGTALRRLTHSGRAAGPRWSPGGKLLAYLDHGNLWIMNADGSHKRQITRAAPTFTDSRPTWSPNGRYLAFVRTRRHHAFGLLTRFDRVTRHFAAFTDTANGTLSAITALPAPVAWAWDLGAANKFGSFILFEGAGSRCPKGFTHCLDAVGFPSQADFQDGFGSSEFSSTSASGLTDPDWNPVKKHFDTDVLTSVEDCSVSPCAHAGLLLTFSFPPPAPVLPGAYEGVYDPAGGSIAYVENVHAVPTIYTEPTSLTGAVRLARGTQPDWQPVRKSGHQQFATQNTVQF